MAKKRVNVRFLILLGSPVVLLGGAAILWKTVPQVKWLYHGTPKSHADKAKVLFDAGKFEDAAGEYKRAVYYKGANDPVWLMNIADCYDHMILKDPANIGVERGFLDKAITTNPNYEPALRKELEIARQLAEPARGPNAGGAWERVADDADALLRAVPNDRSAGIAKNQAIVERALLAGQGSPRDVDDAIKALIDLSNQEPFNADAMTYAIQGKLGRATDQARQSDRAAAKKTATEALQLLEDALAAHPDDANLHFRAAGLFGAIDNFTRAPNEPSKINARILAEYEKANSLAKPADTHYLDIRLSYARSLTLDNKNKEAEAVYDALLKEMPNDIPVRMTYAEFLGNLNGRAKDALALIEKLPEQDPKSVTGIDALIADQAQTTVLAQRMNLQLQLLPTLSPAEMDASLKEIADEYGRYTAKSEQSAQALYLRGQLEKARGETVKAVQTLNAALSLAGSPGSPQEYEQRERIMFALAEADIRTQQTAAAQALLRQIKSDLGRFVPARIALAQLLINEHDLDAAKKEIDELDKLIPGAPIVNQLRLQTLSTSNAGDKVAAQTIYGNLPENTPAALFDKARVAAHLQRKDEVIRLLEAAHTAKPDNAEYAAALARAYAGDDKKDQAIALIDATIAKNGDQPMLKILRADLAGTSTRPTTQQMVDAIDDPFHKELAQYELSAQANDMQGALAHLQAAEKINPDDGHVKDLLFQIALNKGDFATAASLLDWLTKHNADQAGGLMFQVKYRLAKNDIAGAVDQAQQLTKKLPEFSQSWVTLGQAQMAQQNFAEAEQSFTAALARQTENRDAMIGQIVAAESAGHYTQEAQYLTDAIRIAKGDPRFAEAQLEFDVAHGDPANTIKPREEALKKVAGSGTPAEARAWMMLAQANLITANRNSGSDQTSYLQKAHDIAADALKKFPDDLSINAIFADTCLRLNRFDEGLKTIQQWVDRYPPKTDPAPTFLLADYFNRAGKTADQEKALRDLLAAQPDNQQARFQLSNALASEHKLDDALALLPNDPSQPQLLAQRLTLMLQNGRSADAEKELDAALTATAAPNPALTDLQARLFLSTHRESQALKVLEQELSAHPDDLEALGYRAEIFVNSSRNLPQAINDLQTAIKRANTPQLQLLLARAYAANHDNNAAIGVLNDVIASQPNSLEPRLMLAGLYASSVPHLWSQAEAVLNDAASKPSLQNNPAIFLTQSRLWQSEGHLDADKALSAAQKAAKLAPNDPQVIQTLLGALIASRKYQEVLAATDGAVKSKQAPPWMYDIRGKAHKELDNKNAALEDWTAGIDVAANSKDDASVQAIVGTIAKELGSGAAKSRILPRATQGDNGARMMMAYLAQTDGDIRDAVSWVEKVLGDESKISPQMLDSARAQAGVLYMKLDPPDIAKARAVYQKLLDRNPDDVNALNDLACTILLPNSGVAPAEAMPYAKHAGDLVDTGAPGARQFKPFIYDTLGWTRILTGDVGGGMDLLRQARDLALNRDRSSPDDLEPLPEVDYHLGQGYLKLTPPQIQSASKAFADASSELDQMKGKADPSLKALVNTAKAQVQAVTTAPSNNQ